MFGIKSLSPQSLRLLLHIAWHHLWQRKRQSFVSAFGIALGVGFFIAMTSMMQGFQQYFISQIIDVSPHITIKDEFRLPDKQPVEIMYPEGAVELRHVKPRDERRGIKNWQMIMDELSRLPGVRIAPTLNAQAIMRYGSKDLSITLVGIDPDQERYVSNIEKDITQGSLEKLHTRSRGIILGEGVAKKLGALYGDTVIVISTTGTVTPMQVVGIFRTGITQIDNFQAYTLLKRVQVFENRINIVNSLRLRLSDIDRAGPLAAEIESRYRYRTEAWQESNSNVLSIFVVQNAITFSSVGAILIVAAFGIFNIISTVVFEKYKDIAILKSMGFSARDIQITFLLQGLIVGVVGALAGWIIGYSIIEMLSKIEFRIDGEGFIRTEGFILYRSIWLYIFGFVFALISTLFAAFVPSRRAARLDPVSIIRGAS